MQLTEKITLGSRVTFTDEPRVAYTAKAVSKKFAILTRPHNLKQTVIYTIIDFQKDIRSTNNLVFNLYDYKEHNDIDECMRDLEEGTIECSRRNQVELHILKVAEHKK